MRPRSYRLHLERSTSSGNIGLLLRSNYDDLLPRYHRSKFSVDKVAADAKPSHNHQPKKPEIAMPNTAKRSEDKWQQNHLSAAPAAGKTIFFVGSQEKQVADDVRAIKVGDLVKSCVLCKKEFEPREDVHMYHGRPFCSTKCRNARIASDGYTKKQVGLENDDGNVMKPLRRKPNGQPGAVNNIAALILAA